MWWVHLGTGTTRFRRNRQTWPRILLRQKHNGLLKKYYHFHRRFFILEENWKVSHQHNPEERPRVLIIDSWCFGCWFKVVECSRFRGFITWKCQSTTFGIGHCRWNGNGTCTYTCLGEFGLAVGWVGGWLRWWTFVNMQDLMIGFFYSKLCSSGHGL